MKRTPLVNDGIHVIINGSEAFPTIRSNGSSIREGDLHYDTVDGGIYRAMHDNPISKTDWRKFIDYDEITDDEWETLDEAGVL